MPNPSGNNQWGSKNWPSDEDLKTALMQCVKLKYTRKDKIAYLQTTFGLKIGETKLAQVEKRLEIPTVRQPRLPKDTIENAAINLIEKDTNQNNAADVFVTQLRAQNVCIARDKVRDLMREIAPEGFEKRRPSQKKKDVTRVGLISLGPYHEVSADGHEKLNSQALRMGDISIPIYGYRDKFSGCILKLDVLPDSRSAAPLAWLFLDFVKEIGGIPLQMTTDAGPEVGWQHAIQDCFRRLFAPEIDVATFPTAVMLKSVHNIIIESFWRWLKEKLGLNLKAVILSGLEQNLFRPNYAYHNDLFYWIFIPLIQGKLREYQDYWNYHKVRPQEDKNMPSGHIPMDALLFPKKHNPNATRCLIEVPDDAIERMEALLEAEPDVGPRKPYFQWFSDEFDLLAKSVYDELGCPPFAIENAWDMFALMDTRLNSL